jgi:hypothetical protein
MTVLECHFEPTLIVDKSRLTQTNPNPLLHTLYPLSFALKVIIRFYNKDLIINQKETNIPFLNYN